MTTIDGSHANPVTGGYICAKVRRFPERVYGDDRLLYPAVRQGPKGHARFERVSWDQALDLIATRIRETRDRWGGEAILPYSYGGSNGLLTQDTSDATLFRRLGASRLARTVCAAATGAANQALYGKMPSITYQDFPEARFILLWGVNPSSSGIHIIPYIREAQRNGAVLVVVDPRVDAAGQAARTCTWPCKPRHRFAGCALAIHRYLFEGGFADQAFLDAHTHGADTPAGKSAGVDVRARRQRKRASRPTRCERVAQRYATTSPALVEVRLGPGAQPQRRQLVDGDPGAAGGGRQVRRARRRLHDEQHQRLGPRAHLDRAQEPDTRLVNMNHLGRALTEYRTRRCSCCSSTTRTRRSRRPTRQRILKGWSARISSPWSSIRR